MSIYMWRERVPPKESIIYKLNADANGYLRIGLGGINSSGSYSCPYNWKVSIDDGAETTYSGTSTSTKVISVGPYTAGSSHTVTIKPVSESYGWARANGWNGISATYKALLTEIVYDGSYMGYATSATDTGDNFRAYQYSGCNNLINTATESMPNTVTTIGNWFRGQQYASCTSLTSIPNEVLPSSVTTIGASFRRGQYSSCSGLTYAIEEELPSSVTSIGQYFRGQQYAQCTALTQIKGWKDLSIGAGNYRYRNFYGCNANKTIKVLSDVGYASSANDTLNASYVTSVSVPSAYLNNFKNTDNRPRISIDDSKFVGY